jgi:hypothetical protein
MAEDCVEQTQSWAVLYPPISLSFSVNFGSEFCAPTIDSTIDRFLWSLRCIETDAFVKAGIDGKPFEDAILCGLYELKIEYI